VSRSFALGDVLTITTERLVSRDHMDGVYRILNFMTGDDLFTHQLPRASRECRPALLAQHPELAEVEVPDEFRDGEHVYAWLTEQEQRFGDSLDIEPLGADDHTVIDPIAEIKMLRPDMPVIALGPDGEVFEP
jgi:hypothetical protein